MLHCETVNKSFLVFVYIVQLVKIENHKQKNIKNVHKVNVHGKKVQKFKKIIYLEFPKKSAFTDFCILNWPHKF